MEETSAKTERTFRKNVNIYINTRSYCKCIFGIREWALWSHIMLWLLRIARKVSVDMTGDLNWPSSEYLVDMFIVSVQSDNTKVNESHFMHFKYNPLHVKNYFKYLVLTPQLSFSVL